MHKHRALKECRVCSSRDLEPAIDLGMQPWGNHFLRGEEVGKEPYYPLRIVYCRNCCAAQLDYTVPKETMFGDHTYLSGVTRSLRSHFESVAEDVDRRFFAGAIKKAVLDIGSNDGTQLRAFRELGYEILGVESSTTTAKIANEAGVPTINKFFNLEVAREAGKFQVINAAGVFFHLEELHSVAEGIREALAEDGVFIIQFLYMKCIIENLAFDQIYHEHLLYYTLQTLETLLTRHGLSLFDAYLSPIHGGSIVAFATHSKGRAASSRLNSLRQVEQRQRSNDIETYFEFAEAIKSKKIECIAFLEECRRQGKKIYGFGAPVKGNTMLNYFGIGTEHIQLLVEKNKLRRGLYSPGMHIPIAIEEELTDPPDVYFVLAWNFKKEILANNQSLLDRGVQFYFPINPGEIEEGIDGNSR